MAFVPENNINFDNKSDTNEIDFDMSSSESVIIHDESVPSVILRDESMESIKDNNNDDDNEEQKIAMLFKNDSIVDNTYRNKELLRQKQNGYNSQVFIMRFFVYCCLDIRFHVQKNIISDDKRAGKSVKKMN